MKLTYTRSDSFLSFVQKMLMRPIVRLQRLWRALNSLLRLTQTRFPVYLRIFSRPVCTLHSSPKEVRGGPSQMSRPSHRLMSLSALGTGFFRLALEFFCGPCCQTKTRAAAM